MKADKLSGESSRAFGSEVSNPLNAQDARCCGTHLQSGNVGSGKEEECSDEDLNVLKRLKTRPVVYICTCTCMFRANPY